VTLYPAFLRLEGERCLVVGGGPVAVQKAKALLRAGADVTAVAPDFQPSFRRLKKVRLVRRKFRPADLSGMTLAVSATDDQALNARVARLCRRKRVWVNVVDRPALCRFIVPSVVRRGPLTLAISTGGASPAVSKWLGARLREEIGPAYGLLVRALGRHRKRLLTIPMARRRRVLSSWLADPGLKKLLKGNSRTAKKNLEKSIKRLFPG
jgi:precorrin-2 dehydrogenase / sirohydrochlorin ferrochelatase